ncbi:alpha-L-fucosidase [Ulvibacterium sp.]|uniref:alpha-L-fucosidase n=1 Tax=Ulvibacterium sp. TaxID=2665914 RepID=UPI003BACA8C6
MKNIVAFLFTSILVLLGIRCSTHVPPPLPVEPVPDQKQLAWQQMEFYGFIHFGLNTFTDQEWGYGDKSPELFDPSELDARQWARVAKEAGMKGIIITAKHHDGFCLWPSQYTEYSIKNSPWKGGKGDVIKELAAACKEYGLKLGIYTSPWDRSHADYGKPEYIAYFRNQLEELLTQYGDVFEVWFDGANGGDGHYAGADETRRVDKKTYYDWPNTIKMIRKLQPEAIIWSDAGPDARWVGNEHGFAYDITWSPLQRDEVYGGMPEYASEYSMGQENGTHWVPAEADVSIRPGWFYHRSEDDKVKSLGHLIDIYYKSIGQNATLLLNLPVDQRGLIHERDVEQLQKFKEQLDLDFADDLALLKDVKASQVRDGHEQYGAANLVDGKKETYWATEDSITTASVTLDFGVPTTFNRILVQEHIPLGQRVGSFFVEALVNGQWKPLGTYGTIGFKRLLRFKKTTATKIKLTITQAKACPVLSNLGVFNAPLIVEEPTISRNKEGMVRINSAEKGVTYYYTMDGSPPDIHSKKYEGYFEAHTPVQISAMSYDSVTHRKSDPKTKRFDISKKTWAIKGIGTTQQTVLPIDDNQKSNYTLTEYQRQNGLVIDLGKKELLTGFTYTPDQGRLPSGIITHYGFHASDNGHNWILIQEGEFSNVLNNPIEQKVMFNKPVNARFIKLTPNRVKENAEKAVVAEIGVITK